MKVGKIVMVIIEKVAPQSVRPYLPTKSFKPSVTVFMAVVRVKVFGTDEFIPTEYTLHGCYCQNSIA